MDCQIVVTHHELAARAASSNPSAEIIPIQNFMGAPEYDTLVARLAAGAEAPKAAPAAEPAPAAEAAETGSKLLERKNILLNCKPVTPEEAIRRCGELMVESGYVEEAYIQGMLDREPASPWPSATTWPSPTAPTTSSPSSSAAAWWS
jgi:PTS system mannitol-specific IIC component